jgi:subtilisin family serine protease
MLTRKRAALFSLAVIFLSILPILFCSSAACADYAPGKIMIKFKPGVIRIPKGIRIAAAQAATVKPVSVQALNARHGVTRIKELYRDVLEIRPDWKKLRDNFVIYVSKESDMVQVAKEYAMDPNIISAETVPRVHAFDTNPDDPYFASADQYGLLNIKCPQAWDRTTGSSNVVIAVLDTGINYNHEDLQGRVDLVNAKDYVNGDNNPEDDHTNAHGTTVSGVIAAATNNSIGVAGVDWQAQILPIKVLNKNGDGDMDDINEGIAWARAQGADVINMSFGQSNVGPDKYAEQNPGQIRDSCQDAYDDGIVLVAAAGNGNVDWNTYPAYYPTVIAVAAVDQNDERAYWGGYDPVTQRPQASNYGSWIGVSAPGDDIRTTQKNNDYVCASGTSLACPFVSGLAGLVKAANPGATNQQIMDKITTEVDNIDSLNPGYEGQLGSGRINAYLAIAGVIANITSPASGSYVEGSVDIYGSAAGWDFSSYVLEGWEGGTRVATIASSSTSVEAGLLGSWSTTGRNGEHSIRLKVFTVGLGTEEVRATVYVDNITPEAIITSPSDGASATGEVAILGSAKDQYFERYLLEYGEGTSPASFEKIQESWDAVDGGVLGNWETSGLEGIYTIRLTAHDQVGHSATQSIAVDIQQSPVPPTREANPQTPPLPLTFAAPNPFNRTERDQVSFNYSLQSNFDTKIYLFDLSGNLIWQGSYSAGENGAKSGDNNPAWDGKDMSGANVPNGVYVYQIVAEGRAIAKGKVIVLN